MSMVKVLPLQKQYQIKDKILEERLAKLLPKLQKESGIDVWLVPSKEYNEDPVFTLLTPTAFPTARRISLLVLHKSGRRFCINLPDQDLEKYYKNIIARDANNQLESLAKLLKKLKPKTIGLNYSDDFALSDGISVGLYNWLNKLPEEFTKCFVSAQELAIRFLETRCDKELEYYPEVAKLATDIIAKAYSSDVILAGVTTCEDVEWFLKNSVKNLGLNYWFEPTIDLQRKSGSYSGKTIIEKGDFIHCDFGIEYLNLCTDTQRLAYVLKDDEKDIPTVIKSGFKENNLFQDIVASCYRKGKTGNEVFENSLEIAKEKGINAMLYTHPLGTHGHAAGPTIGLYTDQNPQPIKGDLKVFDNTAYALELNTRVQVEDYDEELVFYTEESVIFKDNKLQYLSKGRDKIAIIRSKV